MTNPKTLRALVLSTALAWSAGAGAASPPAEGPTDVCGEQVSLDFRDTRGDVALSELQTRTGVAIEAPARVSEAAVTLKLEDASVDDAVRKVLRALSLSNVAVIYGVGDGGFVKKFVALDTPTATRAEEADEAATPPAETDETEETAALGQTAEADEVIGTEMVIATAD